MTRITILFLLFSSADLAGLACPAGLGWLACMAGGRGPGLFYYLNYLRTIQELSRDYPGTIQDSTWWASLPGLAWPGLAGLAGRPGLAGLPASSSLAQMVCKHAHSVWYFCRKNNWFEITRWFIVSVLKKVASVWCFWCKINWFQQLLIISCIVFQNMPMPFVVFVCKTNWC